MIKESSPLQLHHGGLYEEAFYRRADHHHSGGAWTIWPRKAINLTPRTLRKLEVNWGAGQVVKPH